MKSGFIKKLIERMERVDPEELQTHFIQMVRDKGLLERIINAIQEGVIVTDVNGTIRYLNQAACELFALDPEQAIGSSLSETVRGLNWDELTRSDTVVNREMEVFYPQNRFVNFYVVPLELEESEQEHAADWVPAFAIILRDITETRRSTEETIESERMSALTLLAAGVAHELGNPLNSLNIHLQLMERKLRMLPSEVTAEFGEMIDVSKEEIARLDFIVSQFLRAIRPSVMETRPEDINVVIQESMRFLEKEIRDRDIIVELELASGLPHIEIDRNQIKQAFYNIIRNAFQAMKSSGILHITTELEDDFVRVSFADTGGGISSDGMNRLFQPYHTTKEKGSGLGLLIVRRIVREHGGEISIESDEGKGVTITIRLPLRDKRVRLLGDATSHHSEPIILENS